MIPATASSSSAKAPAALPAATQDETARTEVLPRPTQPAESLLRDSGESSGMSEIGEHGTLAPGRARKEGVASAQSDAKASPVPSPAAAGAAPLVFGKPIAELARGSLELIAKTGTPTLKAAAITELDRRAAVVSALSPENASQAIGEQGAATSDLADLPPHVPHACAFLPASKERSGKRRGRSSEALEWLREALACGPVLAAELKQRASAAGVRARTLERAAARLGVRRERPTFGGAYTWALPMLAKETAALARQHGPAAGNGEHVVAPPSRDVEREVALP